MASFAPSASELPARRSTRSFLPWSRRDEAQKPPPSEAQAPQRDTQRLRELKELRALGDWPRLWAMLRPLRTLARNSHQAELLELFGQCARRGLGGNANDAAQWLTDALWAFQATQHGSGMVRAHRQLAELKLDAGELRGAKRELGYAQTLSRGRQLQAEEALALGVLEGRVALRAGDFELAATHALGAQRLGERAGAAHECRARVLSAEAFILMGRRDAAAVQLLWAERLAPEARSAHEALSVALGRAEALLTMDCPRRAIAVLAPRQHHEASGLDPLLQAHWQRLWGQAHVFDHPPVAQEALDWARTFFARMGSTYDVHRCELSMVRAGHRQHAAHLEGVVDHLAQRMPTDWQVLRQKLAHVREELSLPAHPALGAVRTPWLRAVGQLPQHTTQPRASSAGDSAGHAATQGLWQRLQHKLGAEETTRN